MFIFQSIIQASQKEKEELLGQFEKVQFTKGSTIIKQGDEGATFYVVEDGVCDAFIKGTSKAVASPGRALAS